MLRHLLSSGGGTCFFGRGAVARQVQERVAPRYPAHRSQITHSSFLLVARFVGIEWGQRGHHHDPYRLIPRTGGGTLRPVAVKTGTYALSWRKATQSDRLYELFRGRDHHGLWVCVLPYLVRFQFNLDELTR